MLLVFLGVIIRVLVSLGVLVVLAMSILGLRLIEEFIDLARLSGEGWSVSEWNFPDAVLYLSFSDSTD